MSHITKVNLRVKDLDALEEAAKALGLELRRGQTTHAWFGRFMDDSEEGRRVVAERGVQNLGKCDHALRLAGHQAGDYEVGVAKAADGGEGYDLLMDTWGPGQKLARAVGADSEVLRREYAAACASAKARKTLVKKGWTLKREDLAGGRIQLKLRKR